MRKGGVNVPNSRRHKGRQKVSLCLWVTGVIFATSETLNPSVRQLSPSLRVFLVACGVDVLWLNIGWLANDHHEYSQKVYKLSRGSRAC